MSHISTVSVEILDLECLRKAATKLGLYFREQSTYRWFGNFVGDAPLPEGMTVEDLGKCQYAIGIEGNSEAYEVGVVKKKDGKGYALHYDYWNGARGLEKIIGKDANMLKQAYSTSVARKAAIRAGYRVTEHVKSDGTIILKATGRR